jgi:hypothetical protein
MRLWGVSVPVAVHPGDHHFPTMINAHAIRTGRDRGLAYPKRGADYP